MLYDTEISTPYDVRTKLQKIDIQLNYKGYGLETSSIIRVKMH